MTTHGELPGVIAQHHGIAQEVVCVDTAPDGALGGDLHRVRRRGHCGESEPFEVCRPGGLIGEGGLHLFGQQADQGCGQGPAAHVLECRIIQHEVGMAGAQQIEEVEPALG